MPILRELARRIDPLRAEETLMLVSAVAAGSGAMRSETRQEFISELQRIARGARRRLPPTREALRAAALAAGLAVVED